MNLGKKLINLRKQEKLTQEKFAEVIGVTRQTISNWELNITKPDLNQIEKISKLFHMSIDELLDNDVQNIIVEKFYKTEKIVNKNTKIIKILVITIYFILLISSIIVIIYCLTKKDFTTDYQAEFICESSEGKFKIEIQSESYYDSINTDEEYIENMVKSENFLVISKYYEDIKKYREYERYYAEKSVSDIFGGLEIIKKLMINEYHAKCR